MSARGLTLGDVTFALFLKGLIEEAQIALFRIPSPELNVSRVADRVRRGGHRRAWVFFDCRGNPSGFSLA
jgi:hypothetical protein